MSFMSRMQNGWHLAKTSLGIIKDNKSLLVFPILSGISLVLILITFFGGGFLFFDALGIDLEDPDSDAANIVTLIFIFMFYLVNYFVVIFFNSGLVHCTRRILDGETTSVGEGVKYALNNIGRIFIWATISATVGTLLQLLSRAGKAGEFISKVIGLGWSVLTFFVLPVLLYEEHSVMGSIKQSGRILKDKWGDSLVGNTSLLILQVVALIIAFLITYVLIAIMGDNAIIPVGILFLSIIIVFSAAKTVFMTAVYNHVTDHKISYFDADVLDSAFRAK